MMDYKSILTNYITEANATAGQIVYQPCDGLIEICEIEETRQELLNIVNRSKITNYCNPQFSTYSELAKWAQKDDLLLESSEGFLFCIPNNISA